MGPKGRLNLSGNEAVNANGNDELRERRNDGGFNGNANSNDDHRERRNEGGSRGGFRNKQGRSNNNRGGGGSGGGGGGGGGQGGGSSSSGRGNGHRNHEHRNHEPPPRGGGGGGGARGVNKGGATFTSHRPEFQQQQRLRLVSECGEDSCPVCLNHTVIFAVGMCNHHVCSECSTRMRVLCGQNECAICRQDMPKVIHSTKREKFDDIQNGIFKMDRRSRICFETDAIEESYMKLLEHRCPECPQGHEEEDGGDGGRHAQSVLFRNFKQLDTHIRREHELFYCELCVVHLMYFTHERRLYNRSELATHKRKGDPDNTSHRGHPLCEFCEERFVDKDVLFMHLRREHFFCHFCEADGVQDYFPDYNRLRDHFKNEHFLCLEGDCYEEKFTHAFRSEIDLKAHRAETHSNALTKAAAKENRKVDLDINYSRHQMNHRRGREESPSSREGMVDQLDGPVNNSRRNDSAPPPDFSGASFPTLGARQMVYASGASAEGGEMARRLAMSSGRNVKWSDGRRMPNNEQDFPSLPGSAPAINGGGGRQRPHTAEGYPQLSRAPVKKQPKQPQEHFPSLGGPSATTKRTLGPAAGPAPVYRNNSTAQPWLASGGGGPISAAGGGVRPKTTSKKEAAAPFLDDEDPPLPKPASQMKSKMTTLKKQERKPNSEDHFPGLGPPSSGNPAPPADASAKGAKPSKSKKKKNKGPSIGSLQSEFGASDSLQSAAELIPLGISSNTKRSIKQTEDEEEENWFNVPLKEKAPPKKTAAIANNGGSAIPGLAFNDPAPAAAKLRPSSSAKPFSAGPARPPATEDFPSLGASSKPFDDTVPAASFSMKPRPLSNSTKSARSSATEDFPSLGPSSQPMSATFRTPYSAPPAPRQQQSSRKVAAAPILDDEDPPLPKLAAIIRPKVTTVKKHTKLLNSEDHIPPKNTAGLDSLQSAAALIPLGDYSSTKRTNNQTDDEEEEEEDWSQVPVKEKAPAKKPVEKANNGRSAIPGLAFNDPNPAAPKPRPSSGPPKPVSAGPTRPPATDDFPSLGASSKPMSANFRAAYTPPSVTTQVPPAAESAKTSRAPPPGFSSAPLPQSKKKAPPGFGTGAAANTGIYHQPKDFTGRNAGLVTTITGLVGGGKSVEFQEFKAISKLFRDGRMSCTDYYDNCLAMVGKEAFVNFLPELLALLPDIKKQNELQSIHLGRFPDARLADLTSCPACRQVLRKPDLREHSESHSLDVDFPRLG